MSRQQEALRIAEELLADIELKRLKASDIVLKASRLARLVGHAELGEFLSFERNGYPNDGSGGLWIRRAGRNAEDDKYYAQSIAQGEGFLAAAQAAVQAMQGGGNYSGEYIAITAREHDNRIGQQARAIATWSGICGQVVATIYDIVTEIYHELLFSDLQASLFEATQVVVDGALSEAGGSALEKIERVSDRLRDGDPESISQALTTCRRLIDAVADSVFPARAEPYVIADGVTLAVGQQNVLNRLQAYCHGAGISKGRADRLRRALKDLYDRCSAGAHSDVSVDEARFVFLQTYVVLGEVLTLSPRE